MTQNLFFSNLIFILYFLGNQTQASCFLTWLLFSFGFVIYNLIEDMPFFFLFKYTDQSKVSSQIMFYSTF